MNKKAIVFCLAINCLPSMAAEARQNVLNGIDCSGLDFNKVTTMLKTEKQQFFQDPFNGERCVPISFKSGDTTDLTANDFGGSKGIFNVYQNFLKSSETMISNVQLSDGRIYKFFKMNGDDMEDKQTKKFVEFVESRSKGPMQANYKEWLFFHEMMHLNDHRTENSWQRNKIRAIEATADVGGVIMLSINQGLTVDETLALMKDVSHVRKSMGRKGIDHYDARLHKNIAKNLESLVDVFTNIDLRDEKQFGHLAQQVEAFAFDVQSMKHEKFMEKYGGKELAFAKIKGDDGMNMS